MRATRRDLILAPRFSLDIDAVTGTAAFIGIRGSGKTYTAKRLVEQIVLAGYQSVTIDPLDAWWGLQSSADGKTAGLDVIVFGGSHADVPLEAESGVLLADLVVDEGISAVFSLRHLSKAASRRFVLAFATRLYERKGDPAHRTPIHLTIDEADLFIPQRASGEVASVYGAVDDIVRRGRSSGLGVSLITQRPAVIAKDVLTQCEILFAHRTVGVQDRKALDKWISAHDVEDQADEFMRSLASLATGEVWVWAPLLDVFRRVKIGRAVTFDSSATPKGGRKLAQPKARAKVDLDEIRAKMAGVVERADANDPRKLRAALAQARAELARVKPVVERVEIPTLVVPAVVREEIGRFMDGVRVGMLEGAEKVKAAIEAFPLEPLATDGRAVASKPTGAREARVPLPPASLPPDRAPVESNGPTHFGERERRILSTLVTHGPKTQRELAQFTGYSAKASTIDAGLSTLRKAGYITTSNRRSEATEAGRRVNVGAEELPTGPALLDYWRAKLGKRERLILDVLIEWGSSVDVSDQTIADATGYSIDASTIGAGLSALRKLGLVQGRSVDASFEEAIR